jgi:hypothetical protein
VNGGERTSPKVVVGRLNANLVLLTRLEASCLPVQDSVALLPPTQISSALPCPLPRPPHFSSPSPLRPSHLSLPRPKSLSNAFSERLRPISSVRPPLFCPSTSFSLIFSLEPLEMSSRIEGACWVCGKKTTARCEPCSEAGCDLFLCSRAHQKLVRRLSFLLTSLPSAIDRSSHRSGSLTSASAVPRRRTSFSLRSMTARSSCSRSSSLLRRLDSGMSSHPSRKRSRSCASRCRSCF